MQILAYAFVAFVGLLNAVHSGTNATLMRALARPWWCTLFVCAISGSAAGLGLLLSREPFPTSSGFAQTPWWAWLGTVIAVVPIIATILFAGRLGAASFNGIVVTATLVSAILLDHFGIVGFERHPATLWRIVGGALMIGGLTLVCIF